ncbi:ERAP1-like C-terminal domain-containing protein [Micromonospora zhanjiangensis]
MVTMRWWDDLWLSESFAEYMGWRLAAETDRHRDAWTGFSVRRKSWGYAADQRPSTHPVAAEGVPDTAHALQNFDGISYAKGASVLRQLVAWLGDEAFLAGVRRYFRAHAHGNATLADLLAALGEASGRDVTGWAEAWLRRPQVNTLRPEVTVGPDGRYQRVTVVQTAPPEYPTLRPHRIRVAGYGGDGDGDGAVEVELDPAVDGGRTEVPELVGTGQPRVLLLNDGDLTFAKVRFDPASRAALTGSGAAPISHRDDAHAAGSRSALDGLADPLARALIWAAAVDATRDAEWSPAEFLRLATAALPAETDGPVFEEVLGFAYEQVVRRFLPAAARPRALRDLAAVCRTVVEAAGSDGDGRRLAAARGWLGCAAAADLAGVHRMTRLPLGGLELDVELRWAALRRLVVLGGAGEREIADLRGSDPSAQGALHAAWCRAAIPDPEAKARAWGTVVNDRTTPVRLVAATAAGFWQPEQADLTAGYVARYFTDLPAADRTWSVAAGQLAAQAFPRYAVEPATVSRARSTLARADLDPTLRRVIGDATDDLRRALAARART